MSRSVKPTHNAPSIGADQIKLLERLSNAVAVSGDEGEVRRIVLEEIKGMADEVKVDALGNVLAVRHAAQKPGMRVMLAAHMDEVGFMLVEGVVLGGEAGLPRYGLFALLASSVVLGYLHLRSRALSPALSEARLQALQARIRPHFLFNSINAVLSLIRSEPQRAEQALEDLAGLFRVLMADNRQLVPLRQEVELCRQYLALEQLRLGDRLRVAWHIENLPGEALIPPLVLQPLLENSVYHGIEPSAEAGEIGIHIYRARNAVHLVLTNPCPQQGAHHAGRGMALANVRERLELHFDAEASLSAGERNGAYRVHIMLPYSTRRA